MNRIKSIHLFMAGLAIKIAFLFCMGSSYLRDLFIPFIDFSVQNPLTNPWSHFSPEHFPYGSVLFLFLFIPKYIGFLLVGATALGQSAISLALMKMPLLVLDILLLWTLIQFSTKSLRPLLIYYWLNPILIFISYIHGQLDVAAMCFVLLSILALTKNRIVWSALAMGAATLCKFHTIIVLPFFLVYLWKNDFIADALRRIFVWGSIWASFVSIGFLPIILANNVLYVTVASPQASRILGLQFPMGMSTTLMVGVMILLLMLGRLCLSHRITNRGLLFGSGMLFGTLLAITNPMPGWYFWVMPFLCLFYSTYYTNHRLIFWSFNGLFLSYFGLNEFALFPPNPLFQNIVYTLMQTSVVATLFEIWILVIRPEMPIQKSFKPLMIGIAGDSGVGKNTLSLAFADILGEVNSVILEGDDYHRWERGNTNWATYTHLHPRANQLPTLASHAMELMMGRFVLQRRYDHKTGFFTLPQTIHPNKTIIIQGLHALYQKNMREKFDIKIFVSADESIQMAWKLARDSQERGHDMESLLQNLAKRRRDSQTHIAPQKTVADWHIEYIPKSILTIEQIRAGVQPEIDVRYTFSNDSFWNSILDRLKESTDCEIIFEEDKSDINHVSVLVKGSPSIEAIEKIAKNIFPKIRQLTRSRRSPRWQSGIQGINQLMLMAIIEDKYVNETFY